MAISGGVDSMALAALYSELKLARNYLGMAHAFIVDHKVRSGSSEEAEWVAEQCRSKCRRPQCSPTLDAKLTRCSWHGSLSPASLLARRLRPPRP